MTPPAAAAWGQMLTSPSQPPWLLCNSPTPPIEQCTVVNDRLFWLLFVGTQGVSTWSAVSGIVGRVTRARGRVFAGGGFGADPGETRFGRGEASQVRRVRGRRCRRRGKPKPAVFAAAAGHVLCCCWFVLFV